MESNPPPHQKSTTLKDSFKRTNPFERLDLRAELERTERDLEALRLQYEQFFSGFLPLAPEKMHADLKRQFRRLLKAPFKNSEMHYRLRALESRFSTFQSYWIRVLKQREEGTYKKDLFKANLREQAKAEQSFAESAEGVKERGVRSLFDSYQNALERHGANIKNLDYSAFKETIVRRTEEFKSMHQGKKVSFRVVLKNGKVSLEAKLKQ